MKKFGGGFPGTARNMFTIVMVCLLGTTALAACANSTSTSSGTSDQGIHKIKHIIVIMQENRSFDSYFGTYPGADGIPMLNGVPSVCVPDPQTKTCLKPFYDPKDLNYGGPHGAANAAADINGGKMDGFVRSEESGRSVACKGAFDPNCAAKDNPPDVMGYH